MDEEQIGQLVALGEKITNDFLVHHGDEPLDEYLAHFGVKGMHWGVHQQRELELHSRVASGHGSAIDKYRVSTRMSAIDAIKHKGSVTSFAKERAGKLSAQKQRVQSGNATKRDKAAGLLSLGGEDLVRAAVKKPRADRA